MILRKVNHTVSSEACNQAGVQTEEFLMFTLVEDRLHKVQLALKESSNSKDSRLQYLEFKSNYLQESLYDLVSSLEAKTIKHNSQSRREIERLDQMIEQEQSQLELMWNSQLSSNQVRSSVFSTQEKKKVPPLNCCRETQIANKVCTGTQQQTSLEARQSKQVHERLHCQQLQKTQRQPLACRTDRNQNKQAQTVLRKDSCHKTERKGPRKARNIKINDENIAQSLVRLQAQIKMQNFMVDFERGLRGRGGGYVVR